MQSFSYILTIDTVHVSWKKKLEKELKM